MASGCRFRDEEAEEESEADPPASLREALRAGHLRWARQCLLLHAEDVHRDAVGLEFDVVAGAAPVVGTAVEEVDDFEGF